MRTLVDGAGSRQRRHNHAVLGSWDELIDDVGRRPGMFVGRSFVEGFGYAEDDDGLRSLAPASALPC
jgi:hypothetical protein